MLLAGWQTPALEIENEHGSWVSPTVAQSPDFIRVAQRLWGRTLLCSLWFDFCAAVPVPGCGRGKGG